jgi:hypothetical protein
MGKIISSINIFSSCFKSKSTSEKSKEEPKVPVYKDKSSVLDNELIKGPAEDALFYSFADGSNKTLTQIGLRNDDGYYSASELDYYENLYKSEKIETKPLTAIK